MRWLSAFMLLFCLTGTCAAQAPYRFGFSCDGNFFDSDDRAGSAVSLHIVRNAGKNDRLEIYIINNHYPETKPAWERAMRDSTINGDWSHPSIVDCRLHGRKAAVDALREVFWGAADAPYYHGLQGPPDIEYDALVGIPLSVRRNIWLCSHESKYNQSTGGQRRLDQITGVNKIMLPSGNDKLNTKQNWRPWQGWMHPFDYRRLKAVGRADCSDSTVAGYIVHGVRQTTIAHLKSWIGQ